MPTHAQQEPTDAVANDIIISDLAALVDNNLLNSRNSNLWRPIPYQSDEFSGVMLACGEGDKPSPITVRLNRQGPYRIWLGMYSFGNISALRVRLTSDLCCQTIRPPADTQGIGARSLYLAEALWKEADLTGQDLILEAAYDADNHPGALAYIRLEPIEEIQAAPKGKLLHPLTITNDGHGIWGHFPHSRPEDLLEFFEEIPQESPVRTLLWGIGEGDVCNYPTKVGNYFLTDVPMYNRFYNVLHGNVTFWRDNGWDSLQVMSNYAKRRHWEFYPYIRVEAFDSPFPFDRLIRSEFFHTHPEYHCRDRRGQPVQRLSYAYPEVQDHMLRLIAELAGYDVDGVCLAFIRGIPIVLYEPIMVEGFQDKYGLDPRELDELDPRWLDYQGEVVTAFMKRVKATLKPNQRLSVLVPANERDCRRWGLDVAAWVAQGVIDDLLPVGQRFDEMDVHRDDPDNLDFDWFNQLEGRENVRLIPMLYPWTKFQQDYDGWRKLMVSFLDRGADGYAVWDAGAGTVSRVSDIGYEAGKAPAPAEAERKRFKLLSIEGFRFDRYHYFEVV